MNNFDDVKQESFGKWPGIMAALGIDVGDGRHKSCPVCGTEKKHFRFDDKGTGSWICTCSCGDGWKLIQEVLGCDFKSAIEQVAPIVGTIEPGIIKDRKADPEMLRRLFVSSNRISVNDTVHQYLRKRGLFAVPPDLRFCASCWEPETKSNVPAMLALVQNAEGKCLTMHRTFIDPVTLGKNSKIENPKKLMPAIDKITGGAIRLFAPDNGAVGIAEGIETAIACYDRFVIPTWAAASSTLLESFEPPAGITKVYIFGDNDGNFAGQKAAYVLANRLVIRKKLKVEVLIPDMVGDWLDNINN